MNRVNLVPYALKKWVILHGSRGEKRGITTTFSNLGIIKLPKEIEQRLDHIDFVIDLDERASSCFSCVTAANIMALTISTASKEAGIIAYKVIEALSI